MNKKASAAFWFAVENGPALLTVLFAASILLLSKRQVIQDRELLLWLLGIVGLLATSELVERLRRLKRIDSNSIRALELLESLATPDVEIVLTDRRTMNTSSRAARATQILSCGYSIANFVRGNESFLADRLKAGCAFKFLLLDPNADATGLIDALLTPKPGELINDIHNTIARLSRMDAAVPGPNRGRIEIHLLKTIPSFSLLIVDPSTREGWVQVEIYPSFHDMPLDTGRPHLVLANPSGRWYRYFIEQFDHLWSDPRYSEEFNFQFAAA
jgi:hypothetical protein